MNLLKSKNKNFINKYPNQCTTSLKLRPKQQRFTKVRMDKSKVQTFREDLNSI